jgi:branched-chain amino acid transport system permease protein
MVDQSRPLRDQKFPVGKLIRPAIAILVGAWIVYRMYTVFFVKAIYGPDTWMRFTIAGLIVGGLYALIAIGYTLVYGILGMINFAHGEVMMLGTFAGYFVFEALRQTRVGEVDGQPLFFINAYPLLSVVLAFLAGMIISALTGYYLEKIAYRPLRNSPRLIPLISAIGASIFLQNAVQFLFSPQNRDYKNPVVLARGAGWSLMVNGSPVLFTYTGVLSLVLSILLMVGLYLLVYKTRLGRAMRAVAQDKKTAALMGVNVDAVVSRTFVISGALAGAAGVMWGIHNGLVYFFLGFIPGIKAFTAAVLGGIGNIPGAMVGGLFLGLIESIGPAALGIDFQLKDVIAFLILVLVLIFRPSGLLGGAVKEEKL